MPLTITKEADGQLKFAIGHDQTFIQPAAPDFIQQLEPFVFMQGAASNIADVVDEVASVRGNDNLSKAGIERQITPLRARAVENLAQVWAGFANYEAHIERRDAALVALPQLDPGHAAAAIEDREVRDWWRAQSMEARPKLLEKISSEPGHERLMIALLRSPVAMMNLDHEVAFVRDVWRRNARLNNPAEAEMIDAGRIAVEWSRRGLQQLAAVGMRVIGSERESILQTVLASKEERVRQGYGVFGFGEIDVERHRRVQAYTSRQAA